MSERHGAIIVVLARCPCHCITTNLRHDFVSQSLLRRAMGDEHAKQPADYCVAIKLISNLDL
jgi:hypothetical protein